MNTGLHAEKYTTLLHHTPFHPSSSTISAESQTVKLAIAKERGRLIIIHPPLLSLHCSMTHLHQQQQRLMRLAFPR